jgi:hypothetical protein
MFVILVGVVTAALIKNDTSKRAAAGDDQFIADVRSDTTTLTADRSKVLALGHTVCNLLIAGGTFPVIVHEANRAFNDILSPGDVGLVIRYSVIDLCPGFIPALNDYIASP